MERKQVHQNTVMLWNKIPYSGLIFFVSLILPLSCITTPGKGGFRDPALEKAVCSVLNVEPGRIKKEALLTLKELNAVNAGITSLAGIEFCENLEKVDFSGNEIADITPLKTLKKSLKEVKLSRNKIKSIEPLSDCKLIFHLELGYNRIERIDPLADMESLVYLDLAGNPVYSFDVLSKLIALSESLDLSNTGFSDTSVLVKLSRLKKLNLAGTRVSDLKPLKNLSGLEYLNLRITLFLDDISPLALIPSSGGLKKGSFVDLSYARNEIILEGKNLDTIKSLTAKGVTIAARAVREHRNSDFGKDIFPWVRILQLGDTIDEDGRVLLLEKALNTTGRYFLVTQGEGENRDAVETWLKKFNASKAMLDLVRKTVSKAYDRQKAELKKTDPKKLVEKVSIVTFSGLKTQESFWIHYDYIDMADFRVKSKYECFLLFTVLKENVLNALKTYAEKTK